MHKPKTPRHSRLIRKWDGTPVAESDAAVERPATEIAPASQSPVDQTQMQRELVFDFEREDELSDTLDR